MANKQSLTPEEWNHNGLPSERHTKTKRHSRSRRYGEGDI
jgi:hypothetical protein